MGISGRIWGNIGSEPQAQARRSPLTFSLQLNDGSQPQSDLSRHAGALPAGARKQTDGQVKLRAMGASPRVMEQISQTLQQEAPEMVALADFGPQEHAASSGRNYNATHLRLFGTDARVAHYFPISINKRGDLPGERRHRNEQTLPTTTTGSIIHQAQHHSHRLEHGLLRGARPPHPADGALERLLRVVQNMNRLTSNTLFKRAWNTRTPARRASLWMRHGWRPSAIPHPGVRPRGVIVKLSQAAASKINFRGVDSHQKIASSPSLWRRTVPIRRFWPR